MEHLIAVMAVLGIATLVTGLLLPLAAHRERASRAEREDTLAAELAASR